MMTPFSFFRQLPDTTSTRWLEGVQFNYDMARPYLGESGHSQRKTLYQGNRITVYDVLEYLAGGMTEDEILSDFADLTREDIRAVLAFAAARERRLANSVA